MHEDVRSKNEDIRSSNNENKPLRRSNINEHVHEDVRSINKNVDLQSSSLRRCNINEHKDLIEHKILFTKK